MTAMWLLYLGTVGTSWAFFTDNDNDGVPAPFDCDDTDPQINPYAAEQPNDGVDQDCDGTELCPVDADNDGYGTDEGDYQPSGNLLCQGDGVAPSQDDCDDSDAGINPGEPELPADGVDSNCTGIEICYVDDDGDGFGSTDTRTSSDVSCTATGVADNSFDCDDADDQVYLGAPEVPNDGIDQDCNNSDLMGCYLDTDGDGYGGDTIVYASYGCDAYANYRLVSGDCDDADSAVSPSATELVADGVDQDCDGVELCFSDDDLDGVGSSDTAPGDLACGDAGVSDRSDDCDDTDSTRSPLQAEIGCDGIDQDCDGLTDDDPDDDADGYGACADDCDDTDPNVNPGASEVLCNGPDDDCDPTTPDRIDGDTDGVSICDGDCNDGDPDISPLLDEVLCSGIDEDCDPFTADAPDDDDDGLSVCDDDCDDDDPAVNPTVPEVPCNGINDDCDPSTPDGCIDSADTGLPTDTGPGGDTATDTAAGTDTALPPTTPPATTPPGTTPTTTNAPTAGTDTKAVAPSEPTYGFGCRSAPSGSFWLGLWVVPLLGTRRR